MRSKVNSGLKNERSVEAKFVNSGGKDLNLVKSLLLEVELDREDGCVERDGLVLPSGETWVSGVLNHTVLSWRSTCREHHTILSAGSIQDLIRMILINVRKA